MWIFGLSVQLVWWQWFLMVLGAGFFWGLGVALGGMVAASRRSTRL
jgi:hypothetical protein